MKDKPYLEISKHLPLELATRYKAVPQGIENNVLTLLVDSTVNTDQVKQELEVLTGYVIKCISEAPETVEGLTNKLYRTNRSTDLSRPKIIHEGGDDFLAKIIVEAKQLESSDIHIESYADVCRIRFRIDGKLLERYHIPRADYASFINKIKIRAKLDIAEKRLPQDGRILFDGQNERVDLRVSVMPTLHGEKVVLRLLSSDATHIKLDQLGLDPKQYEDFVTVLKKPNGIILISGPTGSGKTTTLYAALKVLNKEDSNILTIEDPIEYTLEGVNQVQLKENIGLTFSSAIRTFLRQDPDVIMLGEIRDPDTAQMAIRAALTGHLVLSTIHTNSAWGTVARLIDMGVPTFLLANTLNMTMAQRLVRRLCAHCKRIAADQDHEILKALSLGRKKFFEAVGCSECFYTGYSGRIALYEVIPIDAILGNAIRNNRPTIDDEMAKNRIGTLKNRAVQLLETGVTSFEEVYPIILNN